jgi:crotonobetainyl-CoA:carnitine CoA-transferase CaiB-like acyl-CoA transferase
MPSLGLTYEALAQTKSDVIDLRMPGLGCTGLKNHFATVGTNITAFTGFTYLWNHPGKADPPVGSQTVFPDYVSGVFGAIGIIAAVLFRNRVGRGLFIDLSQAEAAAYMIGVSLMESLNLEHDAEPSGNRSPFAAPQGCYPCKGEERWCVIAIETDDQWRALTGALGRPELAEDPRLASLGARKAHESEIDLLIRTWTQDKDCYDVMDRLQSVGVPCGVVQNGADLVKDRHLKARGFLVEQHNARVGHVVLPGFPLKFANSTIEPRWEFPLLGRDNEAVFGEVLGYTAESVSRMVQDGLLE